MSGAARRWTGALATAVVLTAGLAGCGEEETPTQQVPALTDALAEVDAAAVADDDARLREAVAELVRVTEDAEGSGDLDAEDADRIVTAAEALLTAAGEPPADPAPSTTTETPDPSTPVPPPTTDGDDGDDDDEGRGNGKKNGKKKNDRGGDDDEDDD